MKAENVRPKASRYVAPFLAVAVLAMVSCGGVTDPSQNKTESFSGTLTPLAQGGQPVAFFFSSGNGEYSISVTSTNPATLNSQIGVGFGQSIGGACSPISQNPGAKVGQTGLAGAIQQGQWCAYAFDPGILTTATTFQMQVKHP